MNKRKTIGRTFNAAVQAPTPADPGRTQSFALASGAKAEFRLETIAAAELAAKTFVELATNGRDQQALTEESVADIVRTIGLQQFFPAIGRQVDGRIEILDGSRRRAAAIFAGTGLDVLVTEDEIGAEDARQLAADIQTAREHNLREVGMRLLVLRDGGMSQKEIAASQKLSAAKVTRAIQAASVPAEMLSVFPDHAELAYPDYKLLLETSGALASKGIELADVVAQVMVDRDEMAPELAPDELKAALVKSYRAAADVLLAKPAPKKAKVEKLWQFEDKSAFARKRSRDRQFSYEFSRLPKPLQNELDRVIAETLEKHLGE
ncbi:chromosome partitioning protein ParB [Photobacterium gaetbulicola]|uniref:Chromosome partitioning protein ParB n=1 Tax=Photobacterium gaetbulicola TaxID=1295392 RepID=A0A0B9H7J4_9GAMM|nr:ParB family protein [Photobacterium gaetbulicola]KHT64882.1 chromosome partitioning protein ParB [Photobacterium gaetbulicola]